MEEIGATAGGPQTLARSIKGWCLRRGTTWPRLGSVAGLLLAVGCAGQNRETLTLGIPTTVQDSGLLDALLPAFESAYPEYHLRFVAAGSGELLALGARGDLDVVLSHSPEAEQVFMKAGYGLERRRVMENDFMIVGPPADPAAVGGLSDAPAALGRIAGSGALFLSRGDDSGTHRKELALRELAGVPAGGRGYRELGEGMGAVLRAASDLGAYTLCDRATFANLRETLDLAVLVEGDPRLLNVYSVTITAAGRQPAGARVFADWLTSREGQEVIGAYGVDRVGGPLYRPAARAAASVR